jgi:hypothetical protein
MLLQTNSYIVPKDKRSEHARLLRKFRQTLQRLGCNHFEVYEQVGSNWAGGEVTGRFVQIMRFRDRKHQQRIQAAEKQDPVAQQLIGEFCALINFPYQQQQGLFAVGFYSSALPVVQPRKGPGAEPAVNVGTAAAVAAESGAVPAEAPEPPPPVEPGPPPVATPPPLPDFEPQANAIPEPGTIPQTHPVSKANSGARIYSVPQPESAAPAEPMPLADPLPERDAVAPAGDGPPQSDGASLLDFAALDPAGAPAGPGEQDAEAEPLELLELEPPAPEGTGPDSPEELLELIPDDAELLAEPDFDIVAEPRPGDDAPNGDPVPGPDADADADARSRAR